MSENNAPQDALYGFMDLFSDMVAEKLEQRIKAAQPEPLPDNTVFTIDEAAEYLHCGKSSIHRKLKSGEIQGFKSGRWFIHKRELDRWIANGGSA